MLVETALSDPRRAQERTLHNVRRQAIVGDGADPVHASSPLGVMYARKVRGAFPLVFVDDHKAAAEWFIRLYKYRNGRCTPKGTLDIGVRGGSAVEQPKRDAQFRALMCDRRMRNVQLLVCPLVYDIFPRWLEQIIDARREPAVISTEQAEFMAVLDALRLVWVEFGR